MNDATPPLDTKFNTLLREQIRSEFTASQQYIAVAVYCDGSDLPQLAAHFYAQSVEERNHAMMLVQYLLDRDLDVEIPGVDAVQNSFDTPPARRCGWPSSRSARSPSRSPDWPASPAKRAITSANSSCSGS